MDPWKDNMGRFIGLLDRLPEPIKNAVEMRVGTYCWMLNPGRILTDEGDLRAVVMAADKYKAVMSSTNANVTTKGNAEHWALHEIFYLIRTIPAKDLLGPIANLMSEEEAFRMVKDMITDLDKVEIRSLWRVLLISHFRRAEYNAVKLSTHKRNDHIFGSHYDKELKCPIGKLIGFTYEQRLLPVALPAPLREVIYMPCEEYLTATWKYNAQLHRVKFPEGLARMSYDVVNICCEKLRCLENGFPAQPYAMNALGGLTALPLIKSAYRKKPDGSTTTTGTTLHHWWQSQAHHPC
jgi:hypothetical protein